MSLYNTKSSVSKKITFGYGVRQEPPVSAQGGGGGDSEASGGTVLGGSFGCFFAEW